MIRDRASSADAMFGPMEAPSDPSWLVALRYLCLMASLAMLVLFLNRGVDFTDESYYLAWTIDPARYAASIHPFGLPQHLLYEAFGRSLVLFRAAGIVALLAAGAILGWYLADHYDQTTRARYRDWMLSAALISLSYYAYWGSTPNYNLMADAAAALIVAGGLGWASRGRSFARTVSSSLLVGTGGWLLFFAKPTSAGIMAGCVAVILLATCRRTGSAETVRRVGIAGIACVAPLAAIIASTTGFSGFVGSLQAGLAVLNFGNTIGALPVKTLKDLYYSSPLIWITVMTLICVAATRTTYRAGEPPAGLRYLLMAVLILNVLFLAWNVVYGLHIAAAPWLQLGISCLCLVIVQIAYVLAMVSTGKIDARSAVPVPVLLCLVPFALAFGSAISIMPQTGMYLFAPLTASFVVAKLFATPRVGSVVQGIVFAIPPALILWSSVFPHNLAPLYRQTVAARLPFTTDTLRLDPASARYAATLRETAIRERLTPDTPVVDLSGGGPGTMLLLGGRAPFYPWIFQTIGRPRPLVEAAWASLTPAQKNHAWIVGPIDPAFVDTQAVADIRRRSFTYRRVADLVMPIKTINHPITIWKPVKP